MSKQFFQPIQATEDSLLDCLNTQKNNFDFPRGNLRSHVSAQKCFISKL